MIDENTKDEILKNISLSGVVDSKRAVIKHIIAKPLQLNPILNLTSGAARIHSHISSKFTLTLAQPSSLQVLNPFEIRCCLCHEVISYPAWYYVVKYRINHIHYFICFDKDSADKPSTKCYRSNV